MLFRSCGDFKPEEILEEVKKRLIDTKASGEIKRIYPEEPEEIVQEKIEQKLEVSQPLYVIGIKDKVQCEDMVFIGIQCFTKCKLTKNTKFVSSIDPLNIISGVCFRIAFFLGIH